MSSKLSDLLGWPQADVFPTDEGAPTIMRDPNGTYAMFLPQDLTSYAVDPGRTRELLLESDKRLKNLVN